MNRDFLALIDRPRTAAQFSLDAERGRFSYRSEAGERVPGIFVAPEHPASTPCPVVIALHGTNGSKEGMRPLLGQLAAHGWLAIAIDGRHHGERAGDYQDAILNAWRTGKEKPFLYDTVWDVHRLLDSIPQFPSADPRRIALIGISKGGMETYLAAASDERIAAAVPCIGAQSFRWAIDNDSWQARVSTFRRAFDSAAREAGVANPGAEFLRGFYDRVAPGIYTKFDCPQMLPGIAERPLCLINGEIDPRTPMPGLRKCIEAAESAYRANPGRFRSIIQPHTAHQVRAEALSDALDWLGHFL